MEYGAGTVPGGEKIRHRMESYQLNAVRNFSSYGFQAVIPVLAAL